MGNGWILIGIGGALCLLALFGDILIPHPTTTQLIFGMVGAGAIGAVFGKCAVTK